MNNGWIKIHRKLLDWEWYDEPNTFRLFIHLLLKANHKSKKYRGVLISAGQVMTGQELLAKELKLTRSKIRVAINNLKMTNEITIKTNKQGTIIQIVNYNIYQVVTNKTTTTSPDDSQQIATNKNVNTLKNEKKRVFDDWLDYRISMKKPIIVESTFNTLIKRFEKENIEKIKFVVTSSIENGWQGLFWDKYNNKNKRNEKQKAIGEFTDIIRAQYPGKY